MCRGVGTFGLLEVHWGPPKFGPKESQTPYNRSFENYKPKGPTMVLSRVVLEFLSPYYKLSIIRPGRSKLLEFEKKNSTGHLIETYSKYPDQVV